MKEGNKNRNTRRRLFIAVFLLMAIIGSVDIAIRITVRSYVGSESVQEELKKIVDADVSKMISQGFRKTVDDMSFIEKILVSILVDIEEEKERYLSCSRQFVEKESNRMSVGIVSEPVFGMGWCINCYKFKVSWRGRQLATFDVEGKRPVNVRVRSCSKFESQLREECGFGPCG